MDAMRLAHLPRCDFASCDAHARAVGATFVTFRDLMATDPARLSTLNATSDVPGALGHVPAHEVAAFAAFRGSGPG